MLAAQDVVSDKDGCIHIWTEVVDCFAWRGSSFVVYIMLFT